MTRNRIHVIATGALLVLVALLLIERQTREPRPAVHFEFADTTSMSAALRDYDAIQEEKESRLTDSILSRLEQGGAETADWAVLLHELRTQHHTLITVQRQVNARLLLLVCREMGTSYRDCR